MKPLQLFGFGVSTALTAGRCDNADCRDPRRAKRFEYAIRLGALALVTGDVGSGKSTSLRWAASRLHPS
ncbi:hypothetical protein DFAR_570030 [Desulfarculales bacterium]